MNATQVFARTRLADVVERPHLEALAVLGTSESGSLAAVAWCSAHLAAVDHVLHPAARHLPDGRRRLRTAYAVDRRLEQAVSRLERSLGGDAQLVGIPLETLEHDVRERLVAHIEVERALVSGLERALDADRIEALAHRLEVATGHAPTRPHPHVSRSHLVRRLGYPVEAWVDQWRDLLDNRTSTPVHPGSPPHTAGRWGYYLAGVPFPPEEDAGSDESDADPSK